MGPFVPLARDLVRDVHWWEELPPADPVSEPLYAEALEVHLAETDWEISPTAARTA